MTISEKNQEKKRRFEKLSDVFQKYSPYLAALCFAERETLETAFEEGYDDAFAALLRRGYRELYFERERERVFKGLRVLKRRAALLAASADVEGCWNVPHLTRALSVLAELCVRIAVSFALRDAARKGVLNLPDSKSPEKGCGFFVLAMGKLGGRELNYSSDIDLIALFDGDKAPYVGKKDVGSFFVRLTKDVISLLDERGEDGYVFRVDMRLRPDPGSTPVVVSSAAAECYYESFAQNWERAAFIKARVIAGDKTAGEAFLKNIKPFVWRRTSDFYVLEQIRSLKYSMTPQFFSEWKRDCRADRLIESASQILEMVSGSQMWNCMYSITSLILPDLPASLVSDSGATDLESVRFSRLLWFRCRVIRKSSR